MSSASQYQPRPGSSCDKALQAIRIHGAKVSEEAMAVALDVGNNELPGLLGYPLRLGVLKRFREDDIIWWDNGDGVPVETTSPQGTPPTPTPAAAPSPEPAQLPAELVSQLSKQAQAQIEVPQFLPQRRSRQPREKLEDRLLDAAFDSSETLVGGVGPTLLPVKPRGAATYPLDEEHTFEIPIPNKANARITLPAEFDARDWKLLQAMVTAYANRLSPVAT